MSRKKFSVLGIDIDAIDMPLAVKAVEEAVKKKRKSYLIFCTVSSILSARDSKEVKDAFNGAGLVTPDGMPLVWLGRRAGFDVQRVYGPDFMLELMRSTGGSLRHYFYGGGPGVAAEMSRRLTKRFPQLIVSGFHSPPFDLDPKNPDPLDIARINDSDPDVVWVGLGHPKQDLWVFHNQSRLNAPVLAAVGAAFDFHSGKVKEAPEWMKRSGLQWLHRLASDPKRLWRRYLAGNSRFVALLFAEWYQSKRSQSRRNN